MPWVNNTWLWVPWVPSSDPSAPLRPDVAAHDHDLRILFTQALDNNWPPAVFKLSEVSAKLTEKQLAKMGYEEQSDAIPALRVMAFDFRAMGYCEVIYKGYIVPDDVDLTDIEGPIRVRRVTKS